MKSVVVLLGFVIMTMANKIAQAGEFLTVTPAYNPFWVLEGTSFSATCEKVASGSIRLVWNVNGKDPREMKSWGYNIQTSRVQQAGRMHISSKLTKELTVADADEFGPASVVCETETEQEELKEQIFISVHLFSVFTEHPNISEGDDVSLKCSPDYEDAKVLWSRDGHVVDNSSERRVLEGRNRTLVIKNSRPQDAGVYQCTVRIEAGVKFEGNSSEHLEQAFIKDVRVSGKPYLQKEAPSKVDSAINGTLTLTCPVTAFPLPEVYWLRGDDTPVDASSRVTYAAHNGVTGATLKIATMTKEDFGVYECVAQNSVGRLVKEFKVAVGGGRSSVLSQSVDHLARVVLLALCACLVAVWAEM